jgi:hypothetical protein
MTTGSADAEDLAAILADDEQIDALRQDIESHRQAIVDRHGIDAFGPMMLSLARLSGAAEQISVEIRFIRRFIGGA